MAFNCHNPVKLLCKAGFNDGSELNIWVNFELNGKRLRQKKLRNGHSTVKHILIRCLFDCGDPEEYIDFVLNADVIGLYFKRGK